MENQQVVSYNKSNVVKHLKVMNKLGATFFILFLIGTFLPLVDLGEWSNKTVNLYNLANPMLLMVIAVLGVVVNIAGVSKTAARILALSFVVLVMGWLLSQLYDIYDMAKVAREIRGRDFEFKHFVRSIKGMVQGLPISSADDLFSVASILLMVSFIGLAGCIFSPRYKENKAFRALITGQPFENNHAENEIGSEKTSDSTSSLLSDVKVGVITVVGKLTSLVKYVFLIIKPLADALLDKAADVICKQQPQLKREQVKLVVFIVSVIIAYLIFS